MKNNLIEILSFIALSVILTSYISDLVHRRNAEKQIHPLTKKINDLKRVNECNLRKIDSLSKSINALKDSVNSINHDSKKIDNEMENINHAIYSFSELDSLAEHIRFL